MLKSIHSRARLIAAIARGTLSFATGYRELQRTHRTPEGSYYSFRTLYCLTNGRFNDATSWVLSVFYPPTAVPNQANSVLGDVSNTCIARIIRDIETNGFHVFDRKLPAETTNSLRTFAQSIPCQAIPVSGDKEVGTDIKLAPYGQHPVESPKYDIAQRDILGNPTVQQLLMDSGLHSVAQAFLRCSPILDLVAMWWSRPFHGKASSEAAQIYHFDMDRIKFLKFFFYLTDVTPDSGPHCYIRGSSKRKPAAILRDGRIPDDEIRSHYPHESFVEICGEAGSIIAVDTRGWHKGKALSEGERLILQFEYTNSMFGQNYSRVAFPKDANASFREFVYSHTRMFEGLIEI
jgi:hypothetical protein